MTTNSQPAYKAPTGFYQSYSFDKAGNVFADGKQLNGVQLDISGIKTPPATGGIFANSKMSEGNPYTAGGAISRLSVDDKGNVFAELGAPNTAKPTGVGTNGAGTKGPNGAPEPSNFMDKFAASSPADRLTARNNTPAPIRVQLNGIGLDPASTTRSSGGALGDNNAYLRQDRDGLYFAQVNQGDNIVAYGYSKYQSPTLPVGGPAQPIQTRRQGGNAGGGVGPGVVDSTTLLGS